MFKQYHLRYFELDLSPAPRSAPPELSINFVRERIAQSLRQDNILKDICGWGGGETRVGKITVTTAAICLIRDMWQVAGGKENWPEHFIPPKIPLKCFSHRLSRKDGEETIDCEIHPGVDSWDNIFEEDTTRRVA